MSKTRSRRIARTFRALRAAVTTAVALVVAWQASEAWDSLARTRRARAANEVAALVREVARSTARERGLGAIVLGSVAPEPAVQRELDETRTRAREALSRVLDLTGALLEETPSISLGSARDALLENLAQMESARARVRPGAGGARDGWIPAASDHIRHALTVEREASRLLLSERPELLDLGTVRGLAMDGAEQAGVERALVGALLASGERLSPEDRRYLTARRGVVEHELERLAAVGRDARTPPAVRAACARMERVFLGDFEQTRTAVHRALESGEARPGAASRWYAQATGAVDAIVEVGIAADKEAERVIAGLEQDARRRLLATAAGATIVLSLVTFGGIFVRRRVLGPMERLRDVALEIADGELERSLPEGGGDELGDLARAVERMRQTLARQNRSQSALIVRLADQHAQIVQKERLASVGRLASGAAHEINNPLAAVLASIAYVSRELGGEAGARPETVDLEAIAEALADAKAGAERVAAIVRSLRELSERKGDGATSCALDAQVGRLGARLRSKVEPDRSLELDLGAGVDVGAGAQDLGEILERLVSNAVDASPVGGRIVIRTSRDGERAVLEVTDEGAGIARADLPKVLEPFFSTKPVGSGVGLGLSLCHGIVTRLGGSIALRSEPGQGTTARVELPVAPPAEAAGRGPRDAEAAAQPT